MGGPTGIGTSMMSKSLGIEQHVGRNWSINPTTFVQMVGRPSSAEVFALKDGPIEAFYASFMPGFQRSHALEVSVYRGGRWGR